MSETLTATPDDTDYEGVTHAGVALVALDSGRVLLAQRSFDTTDDPKVQETWEFPGGSLDGADEPLAAAIREFGEETGLGLPPGKVINGWRAGPEENYQGFVYVIDTEIDLTGWAPTEETQDLRWIDPAEVDSVTLRPEMRDFDWSLVQVSGNEEFAVMEESEMRDEPEMLDTEPDLTLLDLTAEPLPVHGVLAPEDLESGDSRGFNAGAMTARPYRLPFMWQKEQNSGHDKAVVVGSVDRMMRKDGLIHWEGALMPSENAGEFAELLAFFGRFGVSVDGDKGSLDAERTESEGVVWFDAVRAAGLTAVSIPAFAEAYVAFGPHPDMPADDDTDDSEFAVLRASGDVVTFDRGPGWVTHPRETNRLHRYWTEPGQPGYAKIRWGTPGDFTRAKRLIGEKIGANSPEDMRYLNQIIAQWHYDALGYWPGDLGKPGNAPDTPENRRRAATHASLEITAKDYTEAERKEAHTLPDGSFPIEDCEDLRNAIQSIGRAKDPAAAKKHIRSRKSTLDCSDVDLPETWSLDSPEWDLILTASGARALPPASYFERHPESGALVIAEPDENGIRRTYGYAGEWGVCHIGFDGRCVEVPSDPNGGTYPDFHLGRTKVTGDGGEEYLATGLVTYNVQHRGAKQILSEGPTQAHFDDLKHAWAAVRLGEDERGVWFSGVVLPGVEEDHLVKIEASGQVSGEWKHGALRTLLTVNVPGFPVMRSSAVIADDGTVEALAASAVSGSEDYQPECEPSPAERMRALAQADAEVRFQKLRTEWSA